MSKSHCSGRECASLFGQSDDQDWHSWPKPVRLLQGRIVGIGQNLPEVELREPMQSEEMELKEMGESDDIINNENLNFTNTWISKTHFCLTKKKMYGWAALKIELDKKQWDSKPHIYLHCFQKFA